MRAAPTLLACALALAGCDRADMATQGKSGTWDRSALRPDHSTMQPPVPGSIARGEPNQPVPQPAVVTAALVERGHARYDIFCTPCHGVTGNGDGMIVQRGFPKPDPFTAERLMQAKAASVYDAIADGKGTMYGFAGSIPPADRWAIVAYVRALQVSQKPTPADLPAEDRAKLEATR